MNHAGILIALLLFGAAPAAAKPQTVQPPSAESPEPPPQPLEPDRPDVTNGAHLVDIGLMQLEVGGAFSRSDGDRRNASTPVTVRVGVADWLEARIGGDGLLESGTPQGHETGIGNIQIAAKLRLWADAGGTAVVSILPSINLPTASPRKGLGSGQSDLTLALLTGADVLTHAHVDVNYGVGLIGAGPGLSRFTQHLVSLSASAAVPGPVSPYVEWFWLSRQEPGGGRVAAVDAGAIYVINPRLALDGGIERGISAAAPSMAIFGGLTVVVGNVLGDYGVHARQRQAARRAASQRPRPLPHDRA